MLKLKYREQQEISTVCLTNVKRWGKFNQGKTTQAVISRKHSQDFPRIFMNGCELDISSSFTQLGPSVSFNQTWILHIRSIAKHAFQKLGFLSRVRGYFLPPQLGTIYKSQFPLSLEYCSHIWSGAPKSSLHHRDKIQSNAIRLINNPNLTNSLQSLSSSASCRSFHFLPIFSWTLLSGDQEHHSWTKKACSNNQKLCPSSPFPSYTTWSTNFSLQIIFHSKNF